MQRVDEGSSRTGAVTLDEEDSESELIIIRGMMFVRSGSDGIESLLRIRARELSEGEDIESSMKPDLSVSFFVGDGKQENQSNTGSSPSSIAKLSILSFV